MNRVLLVFCLVIFCLAAKAQKATTDTTNAVLPKPKFINTIYVRAMPLCLYTGADYLKDKINQNIELGKSFGIVDVGAALGRNALRRDTAGNGTTYLEAKITMEIAQYGIVSNEMIIGGGYVFDSKNFLMLELSYSIYAQFWPRVGLGIVTGFYDYSGNLTDNSRNTFGIICRYGLSRPQGGLFNIPRARRMAHVHHHRGR
jgi:hypothetical protein